MGSLGNVDCIVILIVRIFEFVRMNHGSLKIIYFELKLKFAILKKIIADLIQNKDCSADTFFHF